MEKKVQSAVLWR